MFHVLDRSESQEQWTECPHRFSDCVVQASCMWNHPPCRRFRRRRLGAATGLLPLLILVDRVSGLGSHHAFDRWKNPLNLLSMSRFSTRLNAKVPSATAELAVGEGVAALTKRKLEKSERKATKGTEKKKETEPIYWTVESDEVVLKWHSGKVTHDQSVLDTYQENAYPWLAQFTVRGNPLPLRRHRTSRGFQYNPSAAAQKSFRETVESLLFGAKATCETSARGAEEERAPLWNSDHTLAVIILFHMKRPKIHFVAGKPGPGRLRPTAPKQSCSNMRTDVDNLAKFVLDSLNGLLYEDDRQIASLHVTKLYDNDTDELCRGSTRVCLRVLREDDLPLLLSNSFDLY